MSFSLALSQRATRALSPYLCLSNTHTLTHTLTHTVIHTHTLTHTHPLTHTHTHSHSHTHTHTLTYTLTPSLTLTHTHAVLWPLLILPSASPCWELNIPQAASQTRPSFVFFFYCLFKLKATESDMLTPMTQIDTELAAWN